MPGPNQLLVHRNDSSSNLDDLLRIGNDFEITEVGLRNNIDVALRYIEAWLNGKGCVPIHNLMEDAATAEISRTQSIFFIKFNFYHKFGNGFIIRLK